MVYYKDSILSTESTSSLNALGCHLLKNKLLDEGFFNFILIKGRLD